MHRAGLKKRFLPIDDTGKTIFCYCEKGSKVSQQPSIIFIHGFSSDKYTWLNVIKNIPNGFHCIAIDMPDHGESIGFKEEQLRAFQIIDLLKMFFDKLNLTEPMCFVGTSMGGSLVSLFATKYSSYVSMICLLAPPPPGEMYETDMMQKLRSGMSHLILPETSEHFYAAAEALSMRKIRLRRVLAKGYLNVRLSRLDKQKKVLKLAFQYDYPNLKEYYEQLANLTCPALIIWGRQDKLCAAEGAHYFFNLIPDAELIIYDNCGHLITNDKPKETANNIVKFWNFHHDFRIKL